MSLNQKIEEYKSIVEKYKDAMISEMAEKIRTEENDYTIGKVNKFIKRIERATKVQLDVAKLENLLR